MTMVRQKRCRSNAISVSIILKIGLVLCVYVFVHVSRLFPYLRPSKMLQMIWQENENCVGRAFQAKWIYGENRIYFNVFVSVDDDVVVVIFYNEMPLAFERH